MRLRPYYADDAAYRRAELSEIARWLAWHEVTRVRPACVAPSSSCWPRPVESERMSAVARKMLSLEETIVQFRPYKLYWRAHIAGLGRAWAKGAPRISPSPRSRGSVVSSCCAAPGCFGLHF